MQNKKPNLQIKKGIESKLEWQGYLKQCAYGYLDRGFSLIPVIGKKPALPSWAEYQKRQPSKEEVERWFSREDVTGIAIVTGKISGGIVVLDVESLDALLELMWRYQKATGEHFPKAPTVRTGGGGYHIYFAYPQGQDIGNSIKIFPDTDIKADGGYVLAPPSIHPETGKRYEAMEPPKHTHTDGRECPGGMEDECPESVKRRFPPSL